MPHRVLAAFCARPLRRCYQLAPQNLLPYAVAQQAWSYVVQWHAREARVRSPLTPFTDGILYARWTRSLGVAVHLEGTIFSKKYACGRA